MPVRPGSHQHHTCNQYEISGVAPLLLLVVEWWKVLRIPYKYTHIQVGMLCFVILAASVFGRHQLGISTLTAGLAAEPCPPASFSSNHASCAVPAVPIFVRYANAVGKCDNFETTPTCALGLTNTVKGGVLHLIAVSQPLAASRQPCKELPAPWLPCIGSVAVKSDNVLYVCI